MQIDPVSGRRSPEDDIPGVSDTAMLPSVEASMAESRGGMDGSWTLESLEADIAAVGSAMETVDRIVAGVASGEGSVGSAVAEIAAVVSRERFGTPDTDAS